MISPDSQVGVNEAWNGIDMIYVIFPRNRELTFAYRRGRLVDSDLVW